MDFARFLTQVTPADPNGGVANAIHGLLGAGQIQLQQQAQKQQADQFEREQQRAGVLDAWNRQKDVAGMLDKYNTLLATDPDQAAGFETVLRSMGVQFHPAEQDRPAARDVVNPPGAPAPAQVGTDEERGETTQEPAAAERAEPEHTITPQEFRKQGLTADSLATKIGGEEPTPTEMRPAKPQTGGKPIPRLLSVFMSEQAKIKPEESAYPSIGEIAQSAENVRSIGGTPEEPNAPIDPNVGPPDEIAAALKKPMTPEEYRALGPQGAAPVSRVPAPVAPTAAAIPELLRSGKMTGADVKALEDAGMSLNAAADAAKGGTKPAAFSVAAHPVKAPATPEGQAAAVALQAQGIRPALPAFRASFNGIDLGTFDPEAARERLKRQAGETAGSYAAATTEKYRPLVEALIQSGHSPAEIHEMMKTFVGPEVLHLIGADAAVRAAGKKGGGPPVSETLAEEKDGRASVREFTSSAENPGLPDDLKSVRYLPKLVVSLRHPKNGMDSSFTIRQIMLELNKGAFSDKDAMAYMTDVSMAEKLRNMLERNINSSVSPEMREAIAQAIEHKLELAEDNVGNAYNTLVESNQYERGNPYYKRGRRLAAQQVFGGTKFWKASDWGDSDVTPKAGPARGETETSAPPPAKTGKPVLP